MKRKRRVINFILSIVCCLCVFLGSGLESRAEESENTLLTGIFEYEGVNYPYYLSNHVYSLTYKSGVNGYYHIDFSSSIYLLFVKGIDNFPCAIAISDEPFNAHYTFVNNGTIVRDSGTKNSSTKTINGKSYYYMLETLSVNETYDMPLSQTSFSYGGSLQDPFLNYFAGDDFDDLMPFIPDFKNYYHEDTDIWINDMRAELQDGVLYSTWDGLAGNGVFMLEGYENTYIDILLTFVDDKGTVEIADDSYWSPDTFFTELPPNEFSVDMSEFDIPDGYRLYYMIAAPYWYFNDDIKSTMFKGKVTYMFFDENGISDYPLIKNPEDIYNPLDPNLSNWNAITNFTSDYFYNMNNVMNSTFNSWDGSGMGSDNDKLGNALSGYSQHEEVIINQVSSNIRNFDFDNYLTFSDKVNAGISFGSMLINKFFVESGDFTILFVVGCVMVFIFVVVGIWRFSK